jgi:hypothetical protein
MNTPLLRSLSPRAFQGHAALMPCALALGVRALSSEPSVAR